MRLIALAWLCLALAGCGATLPPATPSRVAPSLADPTPVESGEAQPDPAASSWFDLRSTFPDQDSLSGLALLVGTLNGDRGWRIDRNFGPLRPSAAFVGALPWATGPKGDIVAFGYFDGATSHVAVVSTADGQPRLMVESKEVIHAAVLDSTTSIYFLRLSAATRRPNGIDAVDLSSGDRRTVVDLAGEPGQPAQVVIRLFLTDDGRLVLLDCPTDERCIATVYEAGSGRQLRQFAVGGGDAVGLLGHDLVMLGGCELPCPATAYELSSGAARSIGPTCGRAQIARLDGEPVLVSDQPTFGTCFGKDYAVQAFDPSGHPVSATIRFPNRDRELVSTDATTAAEVPAGWTLLGPTGRIPDLPNARLGPLLVRIVDGGRVDLAPIAAS
jgi:hypothetical protein